MKALIVVDVQNDFCPGGALPVPEGDMIIPTINKLLPLFDLIIFTKDWHPEGHLGFASSHIGAKPFDPCGTNDMLWPDHCVQDTPGADLHKDIDLKLCKKEIYFWKKGTDKESQGYSAFEQRGLVSFLKSKGVKEIYVCGLATDYCVKNTALDGVKKFQTSVILDACKGIGNVDVVIEELRIKNVSIIDSTYFLGLNSKI